MITLRQIRSFVAVYEEGSFTSAAEREAATQSGISQHVSQIETILGVSLFERGSRNVVPTAPGKRFYKRCVLVLRELETAENEARLSHGSLSGKLTVGLIPALARRVLSTALIKLTQENPEIDVRIVEAYSGMLTDMVRAGELDFAIIPAFEGAEGLSVNHFFKDREMFVAAADSSHPHLEPISLSTVQDAKIVLPSPAGIVRRQTLDTYFNLVGAKFETVLEIDGMIGTLDFISRSDWVSILPSVLLAGDFDGSRLSIRPIESPPLDVDFVLVQPTRKSLSRQAHVFANYLSEYALTLTNIQFDKQEVS